MGFAEWALLLVLATLWGGSFFFQKVALGALPPFTVLLVRVGLAALMLGTALCLTGQRLPRPGRGWRAFAVMAVLNNVVPFGLILFAQTRIASGLAAILTAAAPLFAAVLAHRLTRDERLTLRRGAGVLVGLAGVTLMVGLDSLAGLGADVTAQLAVLAAALSYAAAGIYGRRFAGTPPLVTAAGQVVAATVLALPPSVLLDRPWTLGPPPARAWAALAAVALLSTALGYVVYFRVLATAGATNLLMVTLLMPVVALLLGTLVLGERLTARHLGGMALIGAGLAVVDGRRLARWRRAAVRSGPAAQADQRSGSV